MTEPKPSEPEYTETIELTDQDREDLAQLHAEPDSETPQHSILEVWQSTLKGADFEAARPVTMQWALHVTGNYPVELKDMEKYREVYFERVFKLRDILDAEIGSDPEAFSFVGPKDDGLENREHYLNLLLEWQKEILSWELNWDCTSETAGIEIASLSEVHKMFFGQTGLTQFLDNIELDFKPEDAEEIQRELDAMKDGHE